MVLLNNHLDVYKLLPKTNCRQCGLAACLAFAVEVIQGRKRLADCPHLPPELAAEAREAGGRDSDGSDDIQRILAGLQEKVRGLDLAAAARRLGLAVRQDRMVIPMLGKEFFLGPDGVVSSCHVNPWLCLPLLNLALHGQGLEPCGKWLPLRDLPGGLDWRHFFEHRCEKTLKKVIDQHTNLFELIMDIFAGSPAPEQFDSDIAVMIHPLPRLPVLICYWRPEDGMDSSLNMFFDATAAKNLPIEALYILCMGLVTMFEKVAQTHDR